MGGCGKCGFNFSGEKFNLLHFKLQAPLWRFSFSFAVFTIFHSFFSDSSAGSISFYSVAGVVREFSCNFFFNFAQVSHAKWHLMLLGYACIWASLSKCVCVCMCVRNCVCVCVPLRTFVWVPWELTLSFRILVSISFAILSSAAALCNSRFPASADFSAFPPRAFAVQMKSKMATTIRTRTAAATVNCCS